MEKTDWDLRYGAPGYLFGVGPSRFLRDNVGVVAPRSRVLCVADGDGRHSVWLAARGHAVVAFDSSTVALDKAAARAREAGVTVERHPCGIEDWDWTRQFDAVVAILVQFAPPDLRARFFADMARALAPGGVLLLHGYTPKQVGYGTGGPPDPDWMYTAPMLEEAFAALTILRLAEYESAGEAGHGRSARIDLIARKPAG